ncbi:LGFP repeat-containing protein [Rhodococcoides kroppenstedtii]|uniref:LGFP repeat-containing protein n=1 Tax=Rhodococcoides kroppenstedtii TaxID=293050 RepID=UPI001BDDEAF8|nr:hypothetical protein [Rhodococcus kroppenstedtii]MBT1191809.1 hypothetical protein [Rhodococcus kroppenstedtii]
MSVEGAVNSSETYAGLEVFECQFERFALEHPWIGRRTGDLMLAPRGGGLLEFQYATVFALPDGGAHEVHGEILAWYLAHGGPGGTLGYPLSNEKRTPTGHGRYNSFEGGTVGWLPGAGAFLMG